MEKQALNNQKTLTGKNDDGTTWTYTGEVRQGLFHGKGKITWSNGEIYEGDWVYGKRTGKGKYTFANGNVYEGDFVDGKWHGKGKIIWTNGNVYEGDWVYNKLTGKGKYTWANGDVYDGYWVDGKQANKEKFLSAINNSGNVSLEGDNKIGFIYCPNCGKSVSVQAKISACPECYHPYNATEWQNIKAQKDAQRNAIAFEEKRRKEEEEQNLNYAASNNKCPLCHQPVLWEEGNSSSYSGIYYTYRHPYCQSCGWKTSLAFRESSYCNEISASIIDWKDAVKTCQENGKPIRVSSA